MSERSLISQESNFLQQMKIEPSLLGALPPNVRDQLLEYVHLWTPPAEQLALIDMLRQAHGSLLFLLDYQAAAYDQQGNYEQVLATVERRQRRSTTLGSQIMEARALLALGHEDHARDVIADISQAFARHAAAVSAAAEVYTHLGQFNEAKALLEGFLARRPGDLQATLTMAAIAYQVNDRPLTDAYLHRLGVGIPPGMTVAQLRQLLTLLQATAQLESAHAVETELQRRHHVDLAELRQALAPFLDDAIPIADLEIRYHRHNGPEAIAVNREEQRNIQLATVRHFGFGKLRHGQTETIATVLRNESILTVMPTGAGKSLCYQLPALMLPRMTLVISPLIALMKDQVESLPSAARAQATFINSTLTEEELARRMEAIAAGDYKLIYAAPERLRQREFLRALRRTGVDLFVIDEAHCVSLWGHDFRPDYLFIQEARLELNAPTTLAMTATAPPRIRDEILDYISNDAGNDELARDGVGGVLTTGAKPPRPRVMAMDIFRHNLHLSSVQFHNEEEKLEALIKFVQDTQGSGIVYVNSRHKSEQLAYQLRQAGIAAEAYHAGLSDRGSVQDRFMNEETRVVVATIAFGMGIDKANIRFIVHFHPSRSLAAYYQEVGRAGRDGKPSQGVLFYSNNDWANLRRWAKSDEYSIEFLHKVYAAIAAQLGITTAEATEDLTGPSDGNADETQTDNPKSKIQNLQSAIGPVDVRRLQQVLNTDETTVRVAVSILERAELIDRTFDLPHELTITLAPKLKNTAKNSAKTNAVDEEFNYLLRGLALRPGQSATFKSVDVANFMGWPLETVESALLDWQDKGYLKVKGSRRSMLIDLPPQPANMDQRLQHLIDQSAVMAQRRIDDVIGYATAESCRHGYISAHFGSPPRNRCTVCDNCTGIRPELPVRAPLAHLAPDDADIEPMIMDCLISLPKPVGRSGLARILAGSLRAPVTADKARHFGVLKALGETTITNYIDDLLEDSRLRQYERQGYSVLATTVRGRAEAELWLAEHPDLAAYGEAQPVEEGQAEEELPSEGDKYTVLQKALWLWRRRCAAEQGQPPYVVMSNELMLRIAETRPHSEEELALLPGMGAQRLQHYGPTILDLVKLNPSHEGDEQLLQTQRTVQAEAVATAKQQIQEKLPTVSAAMEKKIFMKLQELRQKKAITGRMKPYEVAGNTLLKSIAQRAPTTLETLEGILGFRSSGLKDEEERILTLVREAIGQ